MKVLTLVLASLIFIGCSPAPQMTPESGAAGASGATGAAGGSGAVAIKTYPMHGKIIELKTADKAARIEAGPIGDWMGAMTMNYTFKDPAELAKLSVGQTFDATVYVQGDDFWVGDVKPAK